MSAAKGLAFWARTAHRSNGCIEWLGATVRGGYGQLKRDGKHVYAHRLAYELSIGPVPPGMSVLHRCDNPPCCNPAHLFVGTQVENVADRQLKLRQARGERMAAAKLNADAVRAIRASDRPASELAAQYRVCKQTINSVKRRMAWAHI